MEELDENVRDSLKADVAHVITVGNQDSQRIVLFILFYWKMSNTFGVAINGNDTMYVTVGQRDV